MCKPALYGASLVLLCVLPVRAFAKLYINEVMWMGTSLSTSDEWLELVRDNSDCDQPLSLSGVTLTVVNTSVVENTVVRFGDVDFSCGQYEVVSHFAASASKLLNPPDVVTSSLSLPNTKLLVRLRDISGKVIDQADDGIGDPMAGSNGTVKASMERIDFALDGSLPSSWRTATVSQGFDANSTELGTPGYANGAASSSSSPSTSSSSSNFSQPSLPAPRSSSMSEVGSSLSSYQSSPSPSSSQLSVSPPSDTSSSSLSSIIDQNNYSSFSSQSSSSINSSISSFPAPRSSSRSEVGSVPSVIISELLPNPVGSDAAEWIEVANISSEPIDISGWTLSVSGSSLSYRIGTSGSGFILKPHEYHSFQKSLTGISLDNHGKTVLLKSGNQLIDALRYPEVPEGISVGREEGNPSAVRPFCVPTEGAMNADALPYSAIGIQSGDTVGEDSLSLNVQALLSPSIESSAECLWDYQDGFVTTNCNPPSHTFTTPGSFTIGLHIRDYCSNTMVHALIVNVYKKPQIVSYAASSQSSDGSTSSASRSSIAAGLRHARVTYVIDGDTVIVVPVSEGGDSAAAGEVTLRLRGVDAPEVAHQSKPEQPYGNEAKEFLRALLEGKITDLEFDTSTKDSYGRTLAFVSVAGVDVQARLLQEGLAKVYKKSHSSREEEYLKLEEQARAQGKGIWAMESGSSSSIFQQHPSVGAAGFGGSIAPIFISELYPSPRVGEHEWIELFNPNSTAISLALWKLDDAKDSGSRPWKIPRGTWINAGEYLVFSSLQSGLKLNDDSDDLWLTSPDGSFNDHVSYAKAKKGLSFARFSFDVNNLCLTQATPGIANHCNDQKLYSKKGGSKGRSVLVFKSAPTPDSLQSLTAQVIGPQQISNDRQSGGTEKGWMIALTVTTVLLAGGYVYARAFL